MVMKVESNVFLKNTIDSIPGSCTEVVILGFQGRHSNQLSNTLYKQNKIVNVSIWKQRKKVESLQIFKSNEYV